MDFKLDYTDLVKKSANMAQAIDIIREENLRAMNESLAFGQDFVAKYPPPPTGAHTTFVSDKQRRWFFWALSTGVITVPYKRTGTLGKSWTTDVRPSGTSLNGVLGNVRPYGPYVQDEEVQARIHRGRWPTVQALMRTPAAKFRQYFEQARDRVVKRLAGSGGG